MPKFIKKNGLEVRIYSPNAIGAINYKETLAKVNECNEDLDSDQKIEMEPSYLKVRRRLIKALKNCGLPPQEYFNELLLATLSWTDDLEHRVNHVCIPKDVKKKYKKMKKYSKLRKKYHDVFVLSDKEAAEVNLDKIRATVAEVTSKFLSAHSKGQNGVTEFYSDLLADSKELLEEAEQNLIEVSKYFGSTGNPLSSRDKAIYNMFSVLSKNLRPDGKAEPIYAEIAETLQIFYKRKDSKDLVAPMRSAVGRYKKRIV